jgi:hypothetical protein
MFLVYARSNRTDMTNTRATFNFIQNIQQQSCIVLLNARSLELALFSTCSV